MAIWAFVFSGTMLTAAQHTTIVNLAQMPKWHLTNSQNVSFNDVRQWGVEPEVDGEYGVTKVEIRTYQNSAKTLQALVEKAADPSSAFGLLTFYQTKSMEPVKGMKLAVAGPAQAYLARGAFFVRVKRPIRPPMSEGEFGAALIAIGGAAPSADNMALLPPPLPSQGRIAGSLKYVLGPVAMQRAVRSFPPSLVGFRQGAEVQAADYRHDGHTLTLILISYPTNSIARSHYQAMVKSLGVNQTSGAGTIYGKLSSSYVLLVQDAPSRSVASTLMSRLSIKQVVSWDQPPPGKPVTVQMFHLLLGNILLISLLVAIALCAGLLLALSRRLAAKWFPNSDWARAYEGSIIQLHLK